VSHDIYKILLSFFPQKRPNHSGVKSSKARSKIIACFIVFRFCLFEMFFFIIVASRNALLDDLCFEAFSSKVLQIKKINK
jgi:hypothetical protein